MSRSETLALALRPEQTFPTGSLDRAPMELDPYVAEAVRSAFCEFWNQEYQGQTDVIDISILEEQQAALERELKAAQAMIDGVLTLAERNPEGELRLLMDMDETCVYRQWDNGVLRFVLRPALPVVAEFLHQKLGDRFKFGILSTQKQQVLDEHVEQPTFLTPIIDMVDPDCVISSTDSSLALSSALSEPPASASNEDIIEACGIVSPEIVRKAILEGWIERPDQWVNNKLFMLEKIVTNNPTVAFAFADDLAVAAVINPELQKVRGVFLGSDARSYNINNQEW